MIRHHHHTSAGISSGASCCKSHYLTIVSADAHSVDDNQSGGFLLLRIFLLGVCCVSLDDGNCYTCDVLVMCSWWSLAHPALIIMAMIKAIIDQLTLCDSFINWPLDLLPLISAYAINHLSWSSSFNPDHMILSHDDEVATLKIPKSSRSRWHHIISQQAVSR